MSKILCKGDFEGTIVITDPYYFIDKIDKEEKPFPIKFDYSPQYDISALTEEELKVYTERRKIYLQKYIKYVESLESDWDKCNYGLEMDKIGFNNYLCTDNLYGNWSCTLYELNNSENLLDDKNLEIGKFCADSGLVGVFLLSEILKYDPNFKPGDFTHNELSLIDDFKGSIYIINTTDKIGVEAEVIVLGLGNVNFFSLQTGL